MCNVLYVSIPTPVWFLVLRMGCHTHHFPNSEHSNLRTMINFVITYVIIFSSSKQSDWLLQVDSVRLSNRGVASLCKGRHLNDRYKSCFTDNLMSIPGFAPSRTC